MFIVIIISFIFKILPLKLGIFPSIPFATMAEISNNHDDLITLYDMMYASREQVEKSHNDQPFRPDR